MKTKAVLILTSLLVGICAFTSGRYLGSRSTLGRQDPRSNSSVSTSPAPSIAPALHSQDESLVEQEAMSVALLAMLDGELYERHGDFFAAIQRLSLRNIKELHARVLQMPANSQFLEAVAARWVELDPGFAIEYVRSLPDGLNLKEDWGILAAWARQMPESAISEGLRQQATSKGRQMLTNAFSSVAENDPVSAATRLQLISDAKLHQEVFASILESWARTDPEAAARWVQSHPESVRAGSDGNPAIEAFAAKLAVRDPALATQFAQSLPESLREATLVQACREWAFCEAEKALTWCRENGVPVDSTASNNASILAHAMTRAPEKTLAWLGTVPREEQGDLASSVLYYAPVRVAPQIFAMIPPEDQPDRVDPLMRKLNDYRTGDARAWAESLEEGPLREAALSNLMTSFVFRDPVKVIDSFPAGPSRDAAYAAHIQKSAQDNGQPDVDQLGKITDVSRRETAAVSAYYYWRGKAQPKADEWLEATPYISPDRKAHLRAGSD